MQNLNLKETFLYCVEEKKLQWQKRFRPLMSDVHVYFFNTDALKTDLKKFLTADELKKGFKFIKEDDRRNFVSGKALTKLILARYHQVDPLQISFVRGNNNKPVAELSGHENSTISQFNISHTKNLLLIAFCNRPVGVDIEMIDHCQQEIIENAFSERETEIIKKSQHPCLEFYRIWTRKEAILKAKGIGLIDDLKSLEVWDHINHINVPELETAVPYFLHEAVQEDYCISVCYISDAQKNVLFFEGNEMEAILS